MAAQPASNSITTNANGPPPSTLAAQIVQNIQHAPPRRERTDDLQNLLDDFLQAGTNAFVGTDLSTRYQLVDVLLKACAKSLDNVGPFDNVQATNRQAVQVLEVVESTIRQSTDLLLFPSDVEPALESNPLPFFLCLLPRLYQFIGDRYDAPVADAAVKAIRACVSVETKGSFLKSSVRPVTHYLRRSIQEILLFLEVKHPTALPILPTDQTIKAVWQAASPQRVPRAKIPEPSAFWLMSLADRLLRISMTLESSRRGLASQNEMDSLRDIERLSLVLRRWQADPRAGRKLEDLYVGLLSTLRQFMSRTAQKTLLGEHVVDAVSGICRLLQQAFSRGRSILAAATNQEICWSLCTLLRTYARESRIRHTISDTFAAYLQNAVDEHGDWGQTSLDLRLTFYLVASILLEREHEPHESYISQIGDKELAGELTTAMEELISYRGMPQPSSDRPSKRMRMSRDGDYDAQKSSREMIGVLLQKRQVPEQDLANPPPDLWKRLPGDTELQDQVELLNTMSKAICHRTAATESLPCLSCDGLASEGVINNTTDQPVYDSVYKILCHMVMVQPDQSPSELVVKSPLPRVLALVALDRLLSHTANSDHLNFPESALGQWCQQCLPSKTREVRTTAGRVLRRYMSYEKNTEVSRRNRIHTLDAIRQLSDRNNVQEHETCIWTLGQLADLNVSHDEMNIIYFRLVDYLSHPSPMVSGLAYDELLRVFNHESATAKRLLDPYWASIAVKIVGDLTTRPSALQRLCDILGVHVDFFISFTRIHTIPYLVLTKKRDVLERIASATARPDKSQSTVAQLCLSNDQLPVLLARLLMEPSSDTESLMQSLLAYASPEFAEFDVSELLKIDPAPVAFEIFQRAGELGDKHISHTQKAIALLAEYGQRRHGSSGRRSTRRSETSEQAIAIFFETHSLAIIKSLSDIVTEVDRPQTLPDRRRCLIGIRRMIAVAGDGVSGATPQMSACLRSTISSPDLCEDGILAWSLMLKSITDIYGLIEPTFALIERHWNTFSPATQQTAQELVSWLFSEQSELMRDLIVGIPSLGDIELLSKYEADIVKFKEQLDPRRTLTMFANRLRGEDPSVVLRALEELENYLEKHASFLQQSSQSESPEHVVGNILQALLDTCVRRAGSDKDIAHRCARCLGLIGCLDPTRIELSRHSRQIVVRSDFIDRNETVDFIVFFLEEVIVPSFLSNMNTRSQNFLGFAMQELLQVCDFKFTSSRGDENNDAYQKWLTISDESKAVLKPFMSSKYTLKEGNPGADKSYPIFQPEKPHGEWLRELVYDLLRKATGDNANMVFSICKRIVRGQDISIASFLLPYITMNILVGENLTARADIGTEFMQVLGCSLQDKPQSVRDNIILCSQDMFRTLDYLSKWTHTKRAYLANHRLSTDERHDAEHSIQVVQTLLLNTPAETMANRAVECRNYSRALFYWEQHMQQWFVANAELMDAEPQASDPLFEKLQEIYVSIDEPDGIDGASAHIQLFDINQQVLEHRKAGRWTAVQNWSELQLADDSENEQVQTQLISSIRESGQYDVLLSEFSSMKMSESAAQACKPFAIEACWETSNWEKLSLYAPKEYAINRGDFTSGLGSAIHALYEGRYDSFDRSIEALRIELARGLSKSSVSNLQSCRQTLLQLHALREVEAIADVNSIAEEPTKALMSSLNLRLQAIGTFSSDKHYLLGLRRAAMQLSKLEYSDLDISGSWLMSARLYRKQDAMPQAFRAILHASQLDDQRATIENARLLWKDGNHRKAIQSLEGAIAAHAFEQHTTSDSFEDSIARTADPHKSQNLLEAKAKLMLARWTDQAGQTKSDQVIKQYQHACSLSTRWEKGQYCLGRHYDKMLESEKLKTPNKMAQTVLTGELAKHVIENYVRGMAWGAKYLYQTLPRCLTLWCEMGIVAEQPPESKYGTDEVFKAHIIRNRRKIFDMTLSQFKKYIDRLPAWVFYTALNQVCARICHPHTKVYGTLADIVIKVCVTHPQQSLWALLAMVRSTQRDRMARGQQCIAKVQEHARKSKNEGAAAEIKTYVAQGTRTTEQLLTVCNADLKKFPRRQAFASLKDLGFNQKISAPCKLVVPVKAGLEISLPPVADSVSTRNHKAFSKDVVTIHSFVEDVLLLSSLQRPRKVDIRGSDGKVYGVLCKPKDDLRLDQRLLEFNAMIQRTLKKDVESSKRRLYVKTYAVTPLNEECGLIEWVEGLKTHRDILLKLYSSRGISPDYRELGQLLDEAVTIDISKFEEVIMPMFPEVFHEWFVETFPEPEAWYNARMRYTRSCAVMSMVGHALGLGDRHSENIMIEEGNGGVMHVDFNCLFDKGQTFDKPEKVPFRLTANMVSAFGAHGYEGPFRKASELTLGILRQNEDTFMTILEQFVHDPTIDLMNTRKRKANTEVPNTPEGVLESVRSKLRGLLPKESVPLSVEGYAEHLIGQARDPLNLASMYIGWCAFL